MKEVVDLINFIKDLTNDEFTHEIDYLDSEVYFMNGGCFEFAKTLKYFIPKAEYVMHEDLHHVGVKVLDDVYDATGIVKSEEFHPFTKEDAAFVEDHFGIPEVKFEGKTPSEALIHELKECSGTYVNDTVDSINSSVK